MSLLNRFTFLVSLAVIAVVAVAVLAGSGGGGDTQLVSGDALAQAARETAKVAGANVSSDATITIGGLSKPLLMHMSGISDMRGKSGRMVGTYSNLPPGVPGQEADGTIPVEMVSLLPDIYMRSPLFAKALPSGKSWLHMDFAKAGQKLGIGDPTQFAQSDPTQTLSNLRATSDRVERLGSEDVRGVATTHYRATVELKKLPALAPPSQRAAVAARTQRLIQLVGHDSYPMDVWIDGKHLVRRIAFTMQMNVQGQTMTMKLKSDMYGFGPKPRAKRPPASDTYEAPQP